MGFGEGGKGRHRIALCLVLLLGFFFSFCQGFVPVSNDRPHNMVIMGCHDQKIFLFLGKNKMVDKYINFHLPRLRQCIKVN